MVMVDIDNKEYETARKIVLQDKVKFPNFRNYINNAVREYNKKNKEQVIAYANNSRVTSEINTGRRNK